jgi:hypothetical protein
MEEATPRNKMGLYKQWLRLYDRMTAFIDGLGLVDMDQSLPAAIRYKVVRGGAIRHDKTYAYDDGAMTVTGERIDALQRAARITYLQGHVSQHDADNHKLPRRVEYWPEGEYSLGQLIAVSGPVLILTDDDLVTLPDPPTVWCVSIAGINFEYNASDRERFSTAGRTNDAARMRICRIWHHTLRSFQTAGVTCPVLCAIGCGAFAGNVERVPETYAAALMDVLTVADYGTEAVFVSVVHPAHLAAFRAAVAAREGQLKTRVILAGDHGMLGLAIALARKGFPTGILNPSDVEAVRNGGMGMYWNGGHIALEELLAVQTTVLLQHIDLNPGLWRTKAIPVADIDLDA